MNRFLSVGLGGLLLLVVGCGSSPEQLAKDLIAAIEANDVPKIKSLFAQTKKLKPDDEAKFEEEMEKAVGNDKAKALRFAKVMVAALGDEAPPEMKMMLEFADPSNGKMEDVLKGIGAEMLKGMEKMGQEMQKGFGKGFEGFGKK